MNKFFFSLCLFYISYSIAHIHHPFYQLKTIHSLHDISLPSVQDTSSHIDIEVHNLNLVTDSGISFPIIFFDRKSPVVLVLGQRFPGSKEEMLTYAHAFKQYDIVMFDYRWNNMASYSLHPATLFNPVKRFMCDPEEEVHTVISFLLSRKSYREIVGLGQCYSNYMFARAQAHAQKQHKPFFTKLILDSCWLSLKGFMQQIIRDPWLPSNPQHGSENGTIKKLLNSSWINKIASFCSNKATPDVSIIEWINIIRNTPILFIHGSNDLIVPLSDFDNVWNATCNTPKAALITPYQHSDNFHDRRWYVHVCETFINSFSIASFERAIKQ